MDNQTSDVVIIDAIRTPIGALGGVLASVRPDDLAAQVIRCIVDRSGIDPALVMAVRNIPRRQGEQEHRRELA